ncbi:hypothetical protein U1Q18_040422 [Sarracenia purpurea var. burkii]
MAMAVLDGSDKVQKARKVRLPPRRGRVKDQIIGSFVKMVSKVILKAVGMGRKMRKASQVTGEEGWPSQPQMPS